MDTPDAEEIRALVRRYVDTWNRHDMTAWGDLFTDDVDYVNRAGGWWQSNAANVAGHQRIHAALEQHRQRMTYASEVQAIALLAPDVALVHATWTWPHFLQSAGDELSDFHGIITMIMVRNGGRWRIRALQNTVATAHS
jgi:uncharacterized protein (TIGR02246 family)